MKNKLDEIGKLVKDVQSISIRNPSNMTWRQIGEALYSMGWRKTFAERTEYKVTEDDVETAFMMLSNFADELDALINDKMPFVDKVDFSLKHLQIYELCAWFRQWNEWGIYNEIWEKFKKMRDVKGVNARDVKHPSDDDLHDLERTFKRELTDSEIQIFRVGWGFGYGRAKQGGKT